MDVYNPLRVHSSVLPMFVYHWSRTTRYVKRWVWVKTLWMFTTHCVCIHRFYPWLCIIEVGPLDVLKGECELRPYGCLQPIACAFVGFTHVSLYHCIRTTRCVKRWVWVKTLWMFTTHCVCIHRFYPWLCITALGPLDVLKGKWELRPYVCLQLIVCAFIGFSHVCVSLK